MGRRVAKKLGAEVAELLGIVEKVVGKFVEKRWKEGVKKWWKSREEEKNGEFCTDFHGLWEDLHVYFHIDFHGRRRRISPVRSEVLHIST